MKHSVNHPRARTAILLGAGVGGSSYTGIGGGVELVGIHNILYSASIVVGATELGER